jgi:uncharacterized protein (TIGR03083 family)
MEHQEYALAAGEQIAAFAQLVYGTDLAQPVPTCPGWTLEDLVRHTGRVHRWATHLVRERATSYVPAAKVPMDLPPEPVALPDWLAAGGKSLVAVLSATPGDTPMWAWGPDHHARFWSRRMLYETLVHRADAQFALGAEPSIDTAVAVDGIDEFLENLPSAAVWAPRVAALVGDGETIHLHSTDADGEWLIRLGPGGFGWRRGHAKGTVAVRGRAADLFLFVWGRRRVADGDRFAVYGDEALLARWVTDSAI